MLVPATSSPSPTCTEVGSDMTCPSQAQFEMHPSEESVHPTRVRRHRDPPLPWWGEESSFTGWALSKPKGEGSLAPPDFLHRLQDGSDTLWLFNSKTCLPQVMQKNGTLLLCSTGMALNLHPSYMVTRAISMPAWIHQLEKQGRDMAPSAKHTFFTLFFFPKSCPVFYVE